MAYYPVSEVNRGLNKRLGIESDVSHIRKDNDSITDTELFVFSKSDSNNTKSGIIVVGVRGSEPSSLKDWIFTDFRLTHTPAFNDHSSGHNVHSGFDDALNSVWSTLLGDIKVRIGAFETYKLFITGHSLGGALSILIAAKLKHLSESSENDSEKKIYKEMVDNLCVHTFGQPRVGNKSFCSWYDKGLFNQTTRHIYAMDIIPRVPPEKGLQFKDKNKDDWRHCGQQAHYSKGGLRNSHNDVLKFSALFFKGIKKPLTIRRALHNHAPWAYLWVGEGLLTGKPKMFRPSEELAYFAKYSSMAGKRLFRFYIGKSTD